MKILLLKRRKEGQASVIGTIMAIMIMLSFLSLLTTQYVPITMTEYEAQHMNQVLSEFYNLRQNIDNLIISEQTSMGMFSTVTLGTSNVPVFSAPTTSRLSFIAPNITYGESTVSFETWEFGTVTERGAGSLELYAANRYFVPQTVFYENAAVIISQHEGEVVKAVPHFNVEDVGGRLHLSVSMVQLIGIPISITGAEAIGIQTLLHATDTWQYNVSEAVTYTISTRNVNAWGDIFNSALKDVDSDLWNLTLEDPVNKYSAGEDGYGTVTLVLGNVESVVLTTSTLSVKIGFD